LEKLPATKQLKQLATSGGKTLPLQRQSQNATPTDWETEMLKPSFRYFIIPLGAISTLATLSAQDVTPRAQRDTGSMAVRERVVDCGTKSPTQVCVISYDSETSR
jgi:hypothetical protein